MSSLHYKITTERPPNWADIHKAFGLRWKDICVVYGNVIHSPNPVEDDVLAHELVHVEQQQYHDPKDWSARYIADPKFRIEVELPAYRAQYKFWKDRIRNREQLNAALVRMAKDLSGPMYGDKMSFVQAYYAIKLSQ